VSAPEPSHFVLVARQSQHEAVHTTVLLSCIAGGWADYLAHKLTSTQHASDIRAIHLPLARQTLGCGIGQHLNKLGLLNHHGHLVLLLDWNEPCQLVTQRPYRN
jgi:hypothetical protein